MNILFLGDDGDKKEKSIAEVKKQCVPEPSQLKFDYDSLHAPNLKSDELKKALIALPAVGRRRLVVLRLVHKLSIHNKKIIIEFLSSKSRHVNLVLESSELTQKDSFVSKVRPYIKLVELGQKYQPNVFDMTRAIGSKKQAEALKVLTQLIEQGEAPLKIMGAVVWFWGKLKQKINVHVFESGLKVLQEADLNIKRSRLKPHQALEVLVVKLCMILG